MEEKPHYCIVAGNFAVAIRHFTSWKTRNEILSFHVSDTFLSAVLLQNVKNVRKKGPAQTWVTVFIPLSFWGLDRSAFALLQNRNSLFKVECGEKTSWELFGAWVGMGMKHHWRWKNDWQINYLSDLTFQRTQNCRPQEYVRMQSQSTDLEQFTEKYMNIYFLAPVFFQHFLVFKM